MSVAFGRRLGDVLRGVSMSQPWVILTRRYGDDTRSPTAIQLAEAIAELYHESVPGMTEGADAEHPDALLRYGWDDGPMFVLAVNRLHEVRFEEWSDHDFEKELASPRQMRGIPENQALQLWFWLAQGEIDHRTEWE